MKNLAKVKSEEQKKQLSSLAREIWVEHYTPIIGPEQVEYMLDKYLSIDSISSQIEEGYEFYTINYEGRLSGFLAMVPDMNDQTMKLSKLYVHKTARAKGLGKKMLIFAEDICKKMGCKSIWLTVNRHNSDSIEWYKNMGFIKTGELITDIGNGFVMDDFRMEKAI